MVTPRSAVRARRAHPMLRGGCRLEGRAAHTARRDGRPGRPRAAAAVERACAECRRRWSTCADRARRPIDPVVPQRPLVRVRGRPRHDVRHQRLPRRGRATQPSFPLLRARVRQRGLATTCPTWPVGGRRRDHRRGDGRRPGVERPLARRHRAVRPHATRCGPCSATVATSGGRSILLRGGDVADFTADERRWCGGSRRRSPRGSGGCSSASTSTMPRTPARPASSCSPAIRSRSAPRRTRPGTGSTQLDDGGFGDNLPTAVRRPRAAARAATRRSPAAPGPDPHGPVAHDHRRGHRRTAPTDSATSASSSSRAGRPRSRRSSAPRTASRTARPTSCCSIASGHTNQEIARDLGALPATR